jgi:hypothetical protein
MVGRIPLLSVLVSQMSPPVDRIRKLEQLLVGDDLSLEGPGKLGEGIGRHRAEDRLWGGAL